MASTRRTVGIISAAIVAAVAITFLVIHLVKSSKDFPKASWTFSGYGKPQAALISFLWAVRQADGGKIVGSISPRLKQQFEQRYKKQMDARGKSLSEVMAVNAPRRFGKNTGIRIVEKKTVSADLVILRVFASGEEREHTFKMKKIGGEWKVDDIN